ncbi:hypothetical protein EYF80_054613 [Liparis tanakae]|uniref:Uncharacterized protein n=1 Tax=Liparis tanakae TaxID=230148 RepID=A0A4Z2F2D6_9TELE|nr:hypothetical protein EYF80_054613 [Liparis tanakae]
MAGSVEQTVKAHAVLFLGPRLFLEAAPSAPTLRPRRYLYKERVFFFAEFCRPGVKTSFPISERGRGGEGEREYCSRV